MERREVPEGFSGAQDADALSEDILAWVTEGTEQTTETERIQRAVRRAVEETLRRNALRGMQPETAARTEAPARTQTGTQAAAHSAASAITGSAAAAAPAAQTAPPERETAAAPETEITARATPAAMQAAQAEPPAGALKDSFETAMPAAGMAEAGTAAELVFRTEAEAAEPQAAAYPEVSAQPREEAQKTAPAAHRTAAQPATAAAHGDAGHPAQTTQRTAELPNPAEAAETEHSVSTMPETMQTARAETPAPRAKESID